MITQFPVAPTHMLYQEQNNKGVCLSQTLDYIFSLSLPLPSPSLPSLPSLSLPSLTLPQAFGALGALFGGPVAWPISDFFGRKVALMLGGVPTLIGWVFIVLAHFPAAEGGFISMILIGRFLTGFGGGWFIFCVSVSGEFVEV